MQTLRLYQIQTKRQQLKAKRKSCTYLDIKHTQCRPFSVKGQRTNTIKDYAGQNCCKYFRGYRRIIDLIRWPYSNMCIYQHQVEQQHLTYTMLQLLKNTQNSASFAYHCQSRLHPSPDGLYLCMSELDCISANRGVNKSLLDMQQHLVKTQTTMSREAQTSTCSYSLTPRK